MSSLAAAKADNFYYPKDFDPKKHKSLNKYHGSHPLRERASKLDQGILVIRFEMPFNVFCNKCKEMIAKGERFNAEKKAVDNYYSTKIWEFSMRHHCGSNIIIRTDPKAAEYLVLDGARRKVEDYSAKDAEVIELADDDEKARLADPLYRLEHAGVVRERAKSGAEALAELHDAVDARTADPYTLNRAARDVLRAAKRADAAEAAHARGLGLGEGVALAPEEEGDVEEARWALRAGGAARAGYALSAQREAILNQPIFGPSSSASAPVSLSSHKQQSRSLPHIPPAATAASAASAGGHSTAAAAALHGQEAHRQAGVRGGSKSHGHGSGQVRNIGAAVVSVKPFNLKGSGSGGGASSSLGHVKGGGVVKAGSSSAGGSGRKVLERAAQLLQRQKATSRNMQLFD